MNVGNVERVAELSTGRITRMGYQIDFRETGTVHIPAIGLHRNMVLEQIARLGTPVNPSPPVCLGRFQPPINLSRTGSSATPSRLPAADQSVCESSASIPVAAPSVAPTTDSQPPPTPWSAPPEFPDRNWPHASAAFLVASRAALGSIIGSHTSGYIQCWRKTRSKSFSYPFVPPADSAHRSHAETPIAPCSPT